MCMLGDCSDTGLRGPEHFVFAQLLNMAAFVGKNIILYCYQSSAHNDANYLALPQHLDPPVPGGTSKQQALVIGFGQSQQPPHRTSQFRFA